MAVDETGSAGEPSAPLPLWRDESATASEILTPAEVRGLLRACSNTSSTGIRNRALITVLYRGGLRLSEALSLAPRDVDFTRGTVEVRHRRTHRARIIGLDPTSMVTIAHWMARRHKLGLSGDPLFCSLAGRTLHPAYLRQLLPRLATKAGLDKQVNALGLRHTHAAELAGEGHPPELILAQLGHPSLATASRYLGQVDPEERVAAMQRREWSL